MPPLPWQPSRESGDVAVEVKICGITNPADAALAAAGGATYLGVVLSSGPRRIGEDRVAEVVAAAGPVPVFGVFVTLPAEKIGALCSRTGLRGVQLHGGYCREDAARLRARGLVVWRVARLGVDVAGDLEALAADADGVLVEPSVPGVEGGAGVALDLGVACEARRRLSRARLVLAGGLTPDSVADAIRVVRPDVVDVSSGVERRPGRKDPGRLTRFLEAVRDGGL